MTNEVSGARGVQEERQGFAGRDLTGMNFSRQDLDGISFAGSILDGTDFTGASLRTANLCGAILRGAILAEASLSNAALRGADLSDADLRACKLDGATLAGSTLSRANFTDAHLDSAILDGCILTEANLTRASLVGASIRGAHGTDVVQVMADFHDALVDGEWLWNAWTVSESGKVEGLEPSCPFCGTLDEDVNCKHFYAYIGDYEKPFTSQHAELPRFPADWPWETITEELALKHLGELRDILAEYCVDETGTWITISDHNLSWYILDRLCPPLVSSSRSGHLDGWTCFFCPDDANPDDLLTPLEKGLNALVDDLPGYHEAVDAHCEALDARATQP
ncbi:MAG: pentapeptide repeat-containing protein [Actinobacteria bacterium]|nr:pentapeptide repeat-containing protein [Actinomycetota bacterium]